MNQANRTPEREPKLRMKKNRELFYLVYHVVGETSQRPLIYNAQYSLFRGLLTMFALLGLAALMGLAWACSHRPAHVQSFALWAAVFIGAEAIAYLRCKKRIEDLAPSVGDLFLAQ